MKLSLKHCQRFLVGKPNHDFSNILIIEDRYMILYIHSKSLFPRSSRKKYIRYILRHYLLNTINFIPFPRKIFSWLRHPNPIFLKSVIFWGVFRNPQLNQDDTTQTSFELNSERIDCSRRLFRLVILREENLYEHFSPPKAYNEIEICHPFSLAQPNQSDKITVSIVRKFRNEIIRFRIFESRISESIRRINCDWFSFSWNRSVDIFPSHQLPGDLADVDVFLRRYLLISLPEWNDNREWARWLPSILNWLSSSFCVSKGGKYQHQRLFITFWGH